MIKWRMMLTTLPYVAVILAFNAVMDFGFDFQGLVDFGDVGLMLTGGIFLIGFMLAGTMADYKESEKLPGELATALETIEDTLVMAAAAKPELNLSALRGKLLTASSAVLDHILGDKRGDRVFAALTEFRSVCLELDRAGAGAFGNRVLGELHNVRKTVTRIGVISRTGFLATGYALLETMVVAVVGLMMIARFKSRVVEFLLVAFVSLIFIYMLRLIRDLDDPFEYTPGSKSAADVELFPLVEFIARVKARTAMDGALSAPPLEAIAQHSRAG